MSSGMQTAWRQIIICYKCKPSFLMHSAILLLFITLIFLNSKYLVCAVFWDFFFSCFEWYPCKCYVTSCTPGLKNINSFQCIKTTLLLLVDAKYIYIYYFLCDTFPVAFLNNNEYIFIFNTLFSFSEMFHQKVFVQMGDWKLRCLRNQHTYCVTGSRATRVLTPPKKIRKPLQNVQACPSCR